MINVNFTPLLRGTGTEGRRSGDGPGDILLCQEVMRHAG